MKYQLDVCARANQHESIEQKHAKFFSRLREIPHPWGIDGQEAPPAPDIGGNLLVGVTISKLLGKGIRGQICYQFRYDFPEDIAMYDDFVDLSFNPERVDYKQLVCKILPVYIDAFDAYRARIYEEEFVHIDFDKERAFPGDNRNSVYRVTPVSFYDETLCQRAFHLTAAEIVERLSGKIEDVRLLHNGVYIIGSSEPLPLEEADRLCWDMKRWITGE
ncbi:MAG: hypothetical protein MI725_04645 [Pirellulales bacterium]|nr:hypothetical protein [Pirellulales bacterium]